jgi:Flp pilus assembly protein TadD
MKAMRLLLRFPAVGRVLCLASVAWMVGLWACAANNNRRDTLKEYEYRRTLQKEKQEALRAAEEESLQKRPEMTAEEYERLGDFHLWQGNKEMAFFQYTKALGLNPNRVGVRYKRGCLFLERGFMKEAEGEFQAILKAEPKEALGYEGLGLTSLKMLKFGEAEANLRQALRLNPDLWQAYNLLGMVYNHRREFETAILQYRKAISMKPTEGSLYNNLGIAFFLKGDYEEAARFFTDAVKMEVAPEKVSNNLALALCKLGRYQDALEVFKKTGDEASAYNNLGYMYLKEGKNREAIEAFEKALELKPEFYERAYENLKRAKAQ